MNAIAGFALLVLKRSETASIDDGRAAFPG
jgi:hypothetical protein